MAPSPALERANRWSYDVFLSFRGQDTRDTFTGYLYSSLRQKGIITFLYDEDLKPGDPMKPSVLKAIRGSRISIVVFSKNYTSSSWCLDELTEIVECNESNGQIVVPVFYRVDPTQVQEVSEKILEGNNIEKVRNWREALHKASSFRSWHLKKGFEAEFIENIIQDISTRIGRTLLYVAKHPVGIDFHLDELKYLLEDVGPQEVCMIGICGVGGIGKTTIAKAYYNSIYESFEGCGFLGNVRETSNRFNGLVQLQELLLYETLGKINIKVGNVARGINLIRERLRRKRVLIVLDDVDGLHQLEALAGRPDWFGPGSRIIVTTRDSHPLEAKGIRKRYKVKGLNDENALQLLSWNAFGAPFPPEDYEGVSDFAKYTKGLPLALNVLGSFFRDRSITEWNCAINKLKEIPDSDIHGILKVSFEALRDLEKVMFLDIACFFKGENRDHVMRLLENCNFYPDIGIGVLVDKSLVYIEGNELHMHDLVQQMGREIVRRESPNPGRRSRLWFHEDVLQVLEENTASEYRLIFCKQNCHFGPQIMLESSIKSLEKKFQSGTDTIEGILVDMPGIDEIFLTDSSFANMKRLRLLIVRNARFNGGPRYLPNNLRWLEWSNYPSLTLPPDFRPNKLAVLKLNFGSMAHLWDGFKKCSNLTIMELNNCDSLREIPDVSTIPNLEKLIVNKCTNLVDVHESVGFLEKLVFLNFGDCSSLRSLPPKLRLISLEMLRLSGCTSLEKFPEVSGGMDRVKSVDLSESSLLALPSSFGNLSGLQHLDLHSCNNLVSLPDTIYNLRSIEEIHLKDCSNLTEFPLPSENSAGFPVLEFFDASNCGISSLDFLESPGFFSRLETLDLSRNEELVTISSRFGEFPELKFLHLEGCNRLREIVELPPNINHVNAKGCESLETVRAWNVNSDSEFSIEFTNCHKLRINQEINELLDKAFSGETEFRVIIPGSDIPNWFNRRTKNQSMEFELHSRTRENLHGLGISAVVCLEDKLPGVVNILKCDLSINGELVDGLASNLDESLESDHLWIGFFPLQRNLQEMSDGWNRLEISVKFVGEDDEESERVKLKVLGVRFIGKTGFLEEEVTETPEDFMEEVRVLPRKRRRSGTDGEI